MGGPKEVYNTWRKLSVSFPIHLNDRCLAGHDPPEVCNEWPLIEKYVDTSSTNIITNLIMCDYWYYLHLALFSLCNLT